MKRMVGRLTSALLTSCASARLYTCGHRRTLVRTHRTRLRACPEPNELLTCSRHPLWSGRPSCHTHPHGLTARFRRTPASGWAPSDWDALTTKECDPSAPSARKNVRLVEVQVLRSEGALALDHANDLVQTNLNPNRIRIDVKALSKHLGLRCIVDSHWN
jgi:hypothetical protein